MTFTKDQVIEKFRKVHGDKYNYDKMIYKGLRQKIIITCPIHGDFEQIAYNHQTCGCKQCYEESRIITTDRVIKRFKEVHGELYDYSKFTEVKSYLDKIEIICPIHGSFHKIISNHIKGQGCPECYRESTRLTKEKLIEKFRKIHGDRYNYDKVEYVNYDTPVIITCPIHGDFSQLIHTHVHTYNNHNGCGCPECAKIKLREIKLLDINNLINRFNIVHDNKYNYDKMIYTGMRDNITITCPIHGDFEQLPANHLYNNQGCPNCAYELTISKPEQDLADLIKSWNLNILQNDRSVLNPKELDIYIPEKKVAIEFNGSWHHSTAKQPNNSYHYQKSLECEKQGLRLIHVWEWLWNNPVKQKVLINIIKSACGIIEHKIPARKCTSHFLELCECSLVEKEEIIKFFNENNINGHRPAKYVTLLRYENKIVHAFSWGKSFTGNQDWELIRGASLLNHSVIGGSSKLWKLFKNKINPKSVVYYIDYNFFDGRSIQYLDNFEFKDHSLSFWNFFLETGEVKNRQPGKHEELKRLYEEGKVVKIYGAGTKTYTYKKIDV